MSESDAPRHTCLKLEGDSVFVKGTWFWFESRFDLAITDGLDAWICNATEDEVEDRASQWDEPVAEYDQFAERYIGFQLPRSVYKLVDAGNCHKREELVRKGKLSERLRAEAEKCLALSQKFRKGKEELETAIIADI